MPISVEEREDFLPVCPYCNAQLDRLAAKKLTASFLSRRLIYACPYCLKVLGISHRKGLLAN